MAKQRSIALKAYHSPDGRCIHYAAACLRKKDEGSAGAAFVNIDSDIIGHVTSCWIFFYPAGPNRRLLELILSRYAPNFDCENDVLFLCINRPGKGGTSSFQEVAESPEKEYVDTACKDVISIMDYYKISQASLLYMCAGSSFAYSFSAKYPERCAGTIIGISSWILREKSKNQMPKVHSLVHSLAMNGVFGPKWFVSSIAGGSISGMNGLLGLMPEHFIVNRFKKTLSSQEQVEFAQQHAENDGIGFIGDMKWMNDDGDGNDSEFVSAIRDEDTSIYPCNNDGNSMDISVCLSTQQDLGLVYNENLPEQIQILLWHGSNDRMISVEGSAYLASSLPNAKLHRVSEGTHQGTMFFFPAETMVALNMLSS